jgi:signal transduction histidine kinase
MRGLQIVVPRFALKPRLRADQLLVKQILINLLGNAAKYAAKGGNIEIKVTWRKGCTLAIQIKDDGPGISKAKLAAINSGLLERTAYLTENSHSSFGLVLSCRTAKAIGGRLDIRSSVGHGTVASLLLPAHLIEADQVSVH